MKVDILAFGAHPDDVELSCAGTLFKQKLLGYKTAIVDLTRGELGTRGSAEIREVEAQNAAKIMNVDARENLGLPDGFFEQDKESVLRIIEMVRKYQPKIVLANAFSDRHPDHGRGSDLVSRACFLAGLPKIETELEGEHQKAWRPKAIYHYIQYNSIEPDFAVDITGYLDIKLDAILAYKSQFFDPNSKEPNTPISSKEFLNAITFRAEEYGKYMGVKHAEAYNVERLPGVEDLFHLL